MKHWASDLVGKKWLNGGRTPETGMDCWGLYYYAATTYFNQSLPEYPGHDASDLKERVKAMKEHENEWVKLDVPVNGCLVAMGTSELVSHVGMYLQEDGGLVLHSQNNGIGAICQKIETVSNYGLNILGFYLHKSWRT